MPINITVVYFCSANLIPPVAVPPFPRGGANPKGGAPTYHFDQFPTPPKKLHNNEKKEKNGPIVCVCGGEGGRWGVPSGPHWIY